MTKRRSLGLDMQKMYYSHFLGIRHMTSECEQMLIAMWLCRQGVWPFPKIVENHLPEWIEVGICY